MTIPLFSKTQKKITYNLRTKISKQKNLPSKMFAIRRNFEQSTSFKTKFDEYLCLNPPSKVIFLMRVKEKAEVIPNSNHTTPVRWNYLSLQERFDPNGVCLKLSGREKLEL